LLIQIIKRKAQISHVRKFFQIKFQIHKICQIPIKEVAQLINKILSFSNLKKQERVMEFYLISLIHTKVREKILHTQIGLFLIKLLRLLDFLEKDLQAIAEL